MKTAKPTLSRRHFLFAAGTAAAAAGVSTTGREDSGGAAPSPSGRSEPQTGYRLTEHVRNYYRTARL